MRMVKTVFQLFMQYPKILCCQNRFKILPVLFLVAMFGTRLSSSCLAFSTMTKRPIYSSQRSNLFVQLQSSSFNSSSTNNNVDGRNALIQKSQKLSLAPMMDYTDRHFRHLIRLVSRHTLTYTEMITSNAIVHEYRNGSSREDGDEYLRRMLSSPSTDEPCILQLGGSDANQLQEACQIVQQYADIASYTGVNLNCGCPSPKVAGKGCFGAALMDQPDLVRDVTTAMSHGFSTSSTSTMPISVKCRIGTDIHKMDHEEEEYQTLCHFIQTVSSPGIVSHFDIHARQAILTRNISPADNRNIPPLKYHYVTEKLVHDFPHLTFSLNGGVVNLQQVAHLLHTTPSNMVGCMVGRAFAANPWHFSYADSLLYHDNDNDVVVPTVENRFQLLQRYGEYADEEEERWGKLRTRRFLCRAIQNIFAGETNSKRYRIALDQHIAASAKHDPTNTTPLSTMILEAATTHLSDDVLYATPKQSYHTWLETQQNQPNKTQQNNHDDDNDESIIAEWQTRRKEQEKQDKATFFNSP